MSRESPVQLQHTSRSICDGEIGTHAAVASCVSEQANLMPAMPLQSSDPLIELISGVLCVIQLPVTSSLISDATGFTLSLLMFPGNLIVEALKVVKPAADVPGDINTLLGGHEFSMNVTVPVP